MATIANWTNYSGKTTYGASAAVCEVLILVSEGVSQPEPDVVLRRPARELNKEWREKLVNQGIDRENQQDDLSIVKARFGLSKTNYNIAGVEVNHTGRGGLTRDMVLKKIRAAIVRIQKEVSVMSYYQPTDSSVFLWKCPTECGTYQPIEPCKLLHSPVAHTKINNLP